MAAFAAVDAGACAAASTSGLAGRRCRAQAVAGPSGRLSSSSFAGQCPIAPRRASPSLPLHAVRRRAALRLVVAAAPSIVRRANSASGPGPGGGSISPAKIVVWRRSVCVFPKPLFYCSVRCPSPRSDPRRPSARLPANRPSRCLISSAETC